MVAIVTGIWKNNSGGFYNIVIVEIGCEYPGLVTMATVTPKLEHLLSYFWDALL